MTDLPKLERIEFTGSYVIRGYLTDGTTCALDFSDQLDGEMFAPMRDVGVFRQARVDDTGTLVWPNGADVAPEAWVYGWPEHAGPRSASM